MDYTGENGLLLEFYKLRLATEEEKQRLFDALEKEGKAWDAEKKAIVDLPKKCEFKAFDKVLAKFDEDLEWKLDSFTLLWNNLTAKYNPTLKDKLKKFFLHKDYPKEVDVRPDNNSLVIAQYCIGDNVHYELVEYHNRTWVTELCFPVKPSFWAYVPKECIETAKQLNAKE